MALDKQIEIDVKSIKSDSNDRMNPNREQSAVIYDMLSEGPIEGLHNGLNSIYLNGVPLIDADQWNIYKPKRSKNGITCTGSSTTITVPSDFSSTYHSTDDGDRYIRIQKAFATLAGNSSNAGVSGAAGASTITTTASFFTEAMLADTVNNGLYSRIRITGGGPSGTEYVGRMLNRTTDSETTSATISPPLSTTVAYKTIWCDYVGKVTAYNSSTTLTVETAPALSVSAGAGQLSTPKVTSETFQDFLNFKNIHLNIRTGTQHQGAIPRWGATGTPSASFAITPNEAIKQYNGWQDLSNIPDDYNDTELNSLYDPSEGQAAETTILAGTGSGAALGLTNASEIDTVKVTMKFPQGMSGQKIQSDSAGEKTWGHAEFQMYFKYSRDGTNFNTVQIVGPTDNEINTRGTSDAVLIANSGMQKAHHAWGPVNFNTPDLKTPNNGYINTYSKSAFFEEWIIPIEKYKPFTDWKIIIRKVTADNPLAQDGDWQFQNDSVLFAVEAQIHEWLHYPNSAIAALALNASDFTATTLPKRAYEIKGIKCQVPTNYHGRYELTSTSDASYTRNISTGANAGSYQNWDGNMRGDVSTFDSSSVNYDKVWTDNPAWVFYDLCTNKRYGLGNHISSLDIDKYELYQIAQYCDELIDNGKGGTEPRFSANIYLSNSQKAYKVMKDFASVFRGLLFWFNGKLTASTDREKDSVYTFTKGNVIGGLFSYTGSSKKLRTNQVKVTWNDPSQMYRQNVQIVEDTQSIVDSNKVTSKAVVAYGCTSEAQAKRYGKWHLLSEKLQKEIVSFKTGLNANFLRPGDVIEVNDADRHRVQFSGRVSNTGTRNTTTIPLDRTITLASGKTYELTLIYPEEGCYLTDNSEASYSGQTFGGHAAALDTLSGGSGYTNGTYTKIPTTGGTGKDLTVNVTVTSNAVSSISINNKGYGYTDNDAITLSNYGGFTTSGTKATCQVNGLASNTTGVKNSDILTFVKTQDGASNLRNSSNVAVQTFFSGTSRIERETVSTSAGSVSSLSVGTAFTSTPNPDVIWALIVSSSTSGDVAEEVTGSAKKYQVSAITEDNKKPEFTISALEYAEDKFNAVDRGWKIEAPTVEPLQITDSVPAPTGLAVEVSTQTAGNLSDSTTSFISDPSQDLQATVSWATPVTSRTDSAGNAINTKYEYISGYEVEHTFSRKLVKSDVYELITVNGAETSVSIPSIAIGTYRVRIRTVNTLGNYSKWVVAEGATGTNVPTHPANRTYLVPTGGDLSTTMSISSSVVSLGDGAGQTYKYTNPTGATLNVTSGSAAKGTQNFTGMGASATAYLVVNYNTPDLKAIEIKTDTTTTSGTSGIKNRFTYWAEVGASNNGLTAATGTVSITAGTTAITGSSTDFDGEFSVGDFIKIGSGASYNATSDYFRVTNIASDTKMTVDTVSGRTYSGATAAYQSWKPSLIFDGIIGKVTTDGSTNYTLDSLANYKAGEISSSEVAGDVGGASKVASNGYLYYNTQQASAPSAPSNSSVTYTFSSGAMTGGVMGSGSTNWNLVAPTATGGAAGSKMYYVYWSAIEATAGDGTATPTFGSTVYTATNFTGLVKFSGTNTLVDGAGGSTVALVAGDLGSSGSTVIDGGRIDTGTIDADRISTDLLRITGDNFSGDHESGGIGGWTLASDAIYSGTKDTTGYTATNGHITISSGGGIHTPKFYVDGSGNAAFKGDISAGTGILTNDLSVGSSNSIFKATSTGIQLGHATFGSAPFRVTAAGALTATNATITGAVTATSGSFTGSLTSTSGTIGGYTMGSNVLYAGADGTRVSLSTADGIHLGHNTFGSAPFRVTRAGALTASSATITGAITATSGSIASGVTVDGTTAANIATYAGYANTINGYYSGGILDSVRGGTGLNNFSDSSYKNSSITYADILTANPSSTVVWTTADGASYSPTGLTQDIIVTYDGGTTTAACTVRWTYVNVSSSNADYLTSVAFQGSSTGFALGSPSVTLQSGVKYATVVVTHSASSETITLGALISQLVTGGGK